MTHPPQAIQDGKYPMTPAGHLSLEQEYDQLLKVERPRIVETVTWAASNGDRSENADYHYGKKRLREIDKRLQYLEKRLENAQIIPWPSPEQCVRVCFGAVTSIEFVEEGHTEDYQIVGEDEIYHKQGSHMRISHLSPLAKLIQGKAIGDELTFKRPKGETEITIVAIHLPEEAKPGEPQS